MFGGAHYKVERKSPARREQCAAVLFGISAAVVRLASVFVGRYRYGGVASVPARARANSDFSVARVAAA